MSNQRAILLFSDDVDASEDLRAALNFAVNRPWKPNPPEVRYGAPQERYTEEETDQMILVFLKRAAQKIDMGATVIVPTPEVPR